MSASVSMRSRLPRRLFGVARTVAGAYRTCMVTELRVALTVADFDAALAFYRDALGLEEIADWSNWEAESGRVVLLGAGRATLELMDETQAAEVDRIEAGG